MYRALHPMGTLVLPPFLSSLLWPWVYVERADFRAWLVRALQGEGSTPSLFTPALGKPESCQCWLALPLKIPYIIESQQHHE